MKDLNVIITEILQKTKTCENISEIKSEISSFLVDNHWFGIQLQRNGKKIYIGSEDEEILKTHITNFIYRSNLSDENQYEWMLESLKALVPETTLHIKKFFTEISLPNNTQKIILDFLLYNITKDIFLMNDTEIQSLVDKATKEINKACGDVFVFFLSWLKANHKTKYKGEYFMKPRVQYSYNNAAYRMDEYLNLMYYLFNEDYIQENEMYQKAAESKNFADTWLYLALHYMNALRDTDLVRMKHPELPLSPEEVLQKVYDGTFTEMEATNVLSSVTWRLTYLYITPNKTSEHNNIPTIKFHVPTSCQALIGKLLAVCEAHYLLSNPEEGTPLIRQIKTYEQISRYMGEEIGDIFLESNFLTRSANKSYLQALQYLSDSALDSDGSDSKGYILAATARSHKGTYGQYISVTAKYLNDMRFTGYTPEFIAMELFERGVLSFIPSMLLKMITNGEYQMLSTSEQTEMIKFLDMTPYEVDQTIKVHQLSVHSAQKVVNEIISQNYSPEEIKNALHRIANGTAFSKNSDCGCIFTAFGKLCPHDEMNCYVCEYDICSKATIYQFVSEYNRMMTLYCDSKFPMEKEKYKTILQKYLLPKLNEVLFCYKEMYGEEKYVALESILKENII